MKTLIELYDELPLENVLATEMFHPERTVFICPPEVASDQAMHNKLREYFKHRGIRHGSLIPASAIPFSISATRPLPTICPAMCG